MPELLEISLFVAGTLCVVIGSIYLMLGRKESATLNVLMSKGRSIYDDLDFYFEKKYVGISKRFWLIGIVFILVSVGLILKDRINF